MNSAEENLEKTVMHNQNWPEKQRVWACLKLHTAALTQEIATKIERSQCGWAPTAVPLRQADIAREIGIPLKSVHRCVVELEREGWLLRRPVDIGPGHTEMQIRCYPTPRKPKPQPGDPTTAPVRPVYDGLPVELVRVLKRMKLGDPDPASVPELLRYAHMIESFEVAFKDEWRPKS